MNLYSYKGQYPQILPDRIRLSSGLTRTDKSTFTSEELSDAEYVLAPTVPDYNHNTQKLVWSENNWQIISFTQEEQANILSAAIEGAKQKREELFKEVDWRISRYFSQQRLGLPTTDNIEDLDLYAQQLRDIMEQPDMLNISWPKLTN